jgi:hypothetical protein
MEREWSVRAYTKHRSHIWVNHSRTFSHSSYFDGHPSNLIVQQELIVKRIILAGGKTKKNKIASNLRDSNLSLDSNALANKVCSRNGHSSRICTDEWHGILGWRQC